MGAAVHPADTPIQRSDDQASSHSSWPRGAARWCPSAAEPPQVDGSDGYGQAIPDGSVRTATTRPMMGPGHGRPRRNQHAGPVHAQGGLCLSTSNVVSAPRLAVKDLLPFCTTLPPLHEAHVIALSDAAGSLQELVLLALGAVAGDGPCRQRLQQAVGTQAAAQIAEFFMDEWELEG